MSDEKIEDTRALPSSSTKRMIKLPTEFFSTAHLKQAKPTFNQKRRLAELQALAFMQVKTPDYVPGLTRLIQLTADVVECEDFSSNLNPNMSHPWFWRALGFYNEEPMVNFSYYHEPRGGRGEGSVMGAEGTKESNKRQSNNEYVEMPLNPLTSRFGGGLLTLQCILFFSLRRHATAQPQGAFCGNANKIRYTAPQSTTYLLWWLWKSPAFSASPFIYSTAASKRRQSTLCNPIHGAWCRSRWIGRIPKSSKYTLCALFGPCYANQMVSSAYFAVLFCCMTRFMTRWAATWRQPIPWCSTRTSFCRTSSVSAGHWKILRRCSRF